MAQALDVEKGELFEWIIEDKNVIFLKRIQKIQKTKKLNV